ncbi:MAG: dihydropteroate synthase [Planctomycetota bacterium]
MTRAMDDILTPDPSAPPVVMGILNVTPDSFSDGGAFVDPASALRQAQRLVEDGAEILDIGAESTRPGSERVPADTQIQRLKETLPAAISTGAIVSIDTTCAEVARWALDHGASLVNDVSAGRDDPDLLPLVGRRGVPIVLMHMLGQPKSMQQSPHYDDVVAEVRDHLEERLASAAEAGIPPEKCILDPGIGFGKRLEHNLTLLTRGVEALKTLGCAVLIGPSRKRFIGEIADEPDATRRVGGTIAACLAARRSGATLFRVHEVAPVRQAILVDDRIHQ